MNDSRVRCFWCTDDSDYIKYHDQEWGEPTHGDNQLFELLTLEGAQAGLSWLTILKRREGYKKAFASFDVNRVSKFSEADFERLVNDSGIIKNKLKIRSTIQNANAILLIQKEFESFDKFIWSYVAKLNELSGSEISENMSKDLKKRGFNFVGPTICYAFMQASGMVNDHEKSCFKFKEINK